MTGPREAAHIAHFTWPLGERTYETVKVRWDAGNKDHCIEITVSPTGRSFHVYVNGKKWQELAS